MHVLQGPDCLQLDDDLPLDQQVEVMDADLGPLVEDANLSLVLEFDALPRQGGPHVAVIDRFQESRPEGLVDLDRNLDDPPGQGFELMAHRRDLLDWTAGHFTAGTYD